MWVLRIVDRALTEMMYSHLYSQLCSDLSKALPDFEDPGAEVGPNGRALRISFRRILTNRCQMEFEEGVVKRTEQAVHASGVRPSPLACRTMEIRGGSMKASVMRLLSMASYILVFSEPVQKHTPCGALDLGWWCVHCGCGHLAYTRVIARFPVAEPASPSRKAWLSAKLPLLAATTLMAGRGALCFSDLMSAGTRKGHSVVRSPACHTVGGSLVVQHHR